jgi:putative glycosyltransferase (TIGR04372 family)
MCIGEPDSCEARTKIAEVLIGCRRFQEAFAVWKSGFIQRPQWTEAHKRITAAFVFCGEVALADAAYQTRVDWFNSEAKRLQLDHLGIRFLREFTTNIGHMGFLDVYVKAGLMGMGATARPVILFGRKPLANTCYIDYWRKYLPDMISSTETYDRLESLVDYLEEHVHGFMDEGGKQRMSFFWARYMEILDRWDREGRGPLLTLDPEHARRGQSCLREMGVPEGAWYVGLHVREDAWDRVRNANVENYLTAIQSITARGGWVIRMGDPSLTPLPELPQVVDYAFSPHRSDWMDVFLWATNRFFIGSHSGPYQIPPTFGRPCILSNIAPILGAPIYGQDLRLYKRYVDMKDKRPIPYGELLSTGIGFVTSAGHLESLGVELLENTTEEIDEAVVEMMDRLEGRAWKGDDILHRAANEAFTRIGASNGKIGEAFLKRHASLFGVEK